MRRATPEGRLATGPKRVVIDKVRPEIDCGRFPIKRVIGETVTVSADILVDGHDLISGVLLYRSCDEEEWFETSLKEMGNDRWQGSFTVDRLGRYEYSVEAWVDHFKTWRRDLRKRLQAGQVSTADLQIGARLVDQASERALGPDGKRLHQLADKLLQATDANTGARIGLADEMAALVEKYPDRQLAARYPKTLPVVVDPERAGFSTWYELFPRSASRVAGHHGTFRDVELELPRLAAMGFDVIYLPPIHPIGKTNRKGKNNALEAGPADPGSPWAIGSREGGHKSIEPQLGGEAEFASLVAAARQYSIDIALDIAFQCSPDHPYTTDHPGWFRHRPDGTIQYAENPPKKYEDIFPFDFETDEWESLWLELKDVFLHWIERGVRVFRVDNPHTKPFGFWEWLIGEIKSAHPDTIFLAEAFTRPKMMFRLAKLGFSQSYTYFPWRNTAPELRQYHTQLTKGDVCEYFRANSWPNTPDILTEHLQTGGRPAFMTRLVLAATLSANYGIYGRPFERMEATPRQAGSEEYWNSEKYEIRHWESDQPGETLTEFIALLNRIRKENEALQTDRNLGFYGSDNPQLLCYSKHTDDFSNVILVVVNVDPHHTHSGWIDVPPAQLGLEAPGPYQVHDLITGARYIFHGARNYISLDPQKSPAHIFRLRRRVRTERDFEYFL